MPQGYIPGASSMLDTSFKSTSGKRRPVTIKVTRGPIQGSCFVFEEHDTFLLSRASDCHAQLSPKDATAPRHRFIPEANPPDARLRDLGSRNGTATRSAWEKRYVAAPNCLVRTGC
jgi:hypothetical protein